MGYKWNWREGESGVNVHIHWKEEKKRKFENSGFNDKESS